MFKNPTVSTKAHAKINLLLSVTPGVDVQGYHAVTTVMCPVDLADDVAVELTGKPGVRLACTPDPLPEGVDASRNIAHRAAVAMGEAFGRDPSCSIRIQKAIPSQAGLGGGSSDAAAVIRALAHLWGVASGDPRLQQVAASLGADVPFFLHEVPMLLEGRGDEPVERFAPFSVPLVLVKPPVGVATGEAYRVFDQLAPAVLDAGSLVDALRRGDAPSALAHCGNNMEPAAFKIAPALVDVFAFLDEQPGLLRAPLLCGSGSCVAAFLRSEQDAEEAAFEAWDRGWWGAASRTLA